MGTEKATRETIKDRLKSPVVWLAVLAQVAVIVGLFVPNVSDNIKVVGTAIVEILTMFGVLNNPADGNNF